MSELLVGAAELNIDAAIRSMEDALTLDGIAAASGMSPFGSQLMGEFKPDPAQSPVQPMLTGGPTWTGTGAVQDSDDGDTDFHGGL